MVGKKIKLCFRTQSRFLFVTVARNLLYFTTATLVLISVLKDWTQCAVNWLMALLHLALIQYQELQSGIVQWPFYQMTAISFLNKNKCSISVRPLQHPFYFFTVSHLYKDFGEIEVIHNSHSKALCIDFSLVICFILEDLTLFFDTLVSTKWICVITCRSLLTICLSKTKL